MTNIKKGEYSAWFVHKKERKHCEFGYTFILPLVISHIIFEYYDFDVS